MPITATPLTGSADKNLLFIRQWVVEVTGRHNLVDASYNDNGMDKYINEAQRSLDFRVYPDGFYGRRILNLAVGDDTFTVKNLLYAEAVWVVDPTDSSRTLLKKQEVSVLLAKMSTSLENGTPKWYAPNYILFAPQQTGDAGTYYGDDDIDESGDEVTEGFLLYPLADAAYTVQVYGKFRNLDLSDNTDTSIWTFKHPYVLVLETARKIEEAQNNRTGAEAYGRMVEKELLEIAKIGILRETEDQTTAKQG